MQRAPDHVPPGGRTRPTRSRCTSTSRSPTSRPPPSTPRASGARRLCGDDDWITLADPAGHPFDLCQADVEGTTVFAVTIDTADAPALGRFYSGLLGLEVTYEGPEGVLIGTEGHSR